MFIVHCPTSQTKIIIKYAPGYSDTNGDTRFQDITIPLKDAGVIGKLSEGFPVSPVIFREVEASYDYNFHNAPQRQYLILVDGEICVYYSAIK